MEPDKIYSVKKIAEMIGVCENTVRKLISKERINKVKLGKCRIGILESEYNRYIANISNVAPGADSKL